MLQQIINQSNEEQWDDYNKEYNEDSGLEEDLGNRKRL